MKPRLLHKGDEPRAGMVLARGVGPLQKGAVLADADVAKLREVDWKELSIVEMEAGQSPAHLLLRQAIGMVIGLAVFAVAAKMDAERWEKWAWALMILTIVMLLIVILPCRHRRRRRGRQRPNG